MKNKNILLRFKTVEEKQEHQKLVMEVKNRIPRKIDNQEAINIALKHFVGSDANEPKSLQRTKILL